MSAIAHGGNEAISAGIPPNMDILCVEQEVAASDEISALQMVVNADTQRTALLAEAKQIEESMEKGGDEWYAPISEMMKVGERGKAEDLSVGAKVRFQGKTMTIKHVDEKDLPPDHLCLQSEFDPDGSIAERLRDVYDELADIGADSAEVRASTILSGLQFLEEQKSWPTSSFSGGWRMRISLARALFRKPRLLLLDEPTNHLDLHAVIWLEGYLQKWKHTLVVVSHDRDFLTTVCTDILHCWQRKLVHYSGNYEVFEKVHRSRLEEYRKEFERQQKRLKELRKTGKIGKGELEQKEIATVLGKNGSKGGNKEHAAFGGGGDDDDDVEQLALLDQIKELNMHIDFKVGGEIAMPILAVDRVSFNYPGGKTLFTNVDFGINMDSRIALVGANGTGKSSLLKLMLQQLSPTDGEVRQSRMCRIGVYSQHSCDQLAVDVKLAKGEKLTPVSYLLHKFPDRNYQEVRNMLGRFGLEGRHHEQEIKTLSGGQKSRVVFVELGMQRSHLLLLDEPTNHLDLETVDCLVTALHQFAGGVMVITHNMSLINKVCRDIWIIEEGDGKPGGEGGTVRKWQGEFEEYRDLLAEEMNQIVDEDPAVKARERAEKEAREAAKEAAKAAAEGGEDGAAAANKPKSKAQRDKERAEARAAARARDEAAAAAKREAEEAEQAERAAKDAAVALAAKEAAERQLKHESDLAKAAIASRDIPLPKACATLVARCESAEAACGALLVLTQNHSPASLAAPLLNAILTAGRQLPQPGAEGGAASSAADGVVPPLVASWAWPLGWLVRRCDSVDAGERSVLAAFEKACVEHKHVAGEITPSLKALWEANVLSEEAIASWAATAAPSGASAAGARRARKFAGPFVEWLRTAETVGGEDEAAEPRLMPSAAAEAEPAVEVA
jgi:ATP-binding cassette subfamily F protein 1